MLFSYDHEHPDALFVADNLRAVAFAGGVFRQLYGAWGRLAQLSVAGVMLGFAGQLYHELLAALDVPIAEHAGRTFGVADLGYFYWDLLHIFDMGLAIGTGIHTKERHRPPPASDAAILTSRVGDEGRLRLAH